MNYLAHLALSNGIEEILVGNMIEDFITGRIEHPRNSFLTPKLIVGVRLHRHIDSFTDSHHVVQECNAVFHPSVGKYASIVTDILFDHFLIKNWHTFYKIPVQQYCDYVYAILPKYNTYYPTPLQQVIKSMVSYKWLLDYEHHHGIIRAYQSVNMKIGKNNFLDVSMPVFEENYDYLNKQFLAFYPGLKQMSDDFIAHALT